MVDFKRPSNKKRGFYEKMKLLQYRHGRQDQFFFCFRYLKWVLWVFLSLYFFSSYLLSSNSNTPLISLPKPTFSTFSRALFETTNDTVLLKPTNKKEQLVHVPSSSSSSSSSSGLPIDFRIYIYNLPSKYNSDWLSNERCSNHLFAAEVALHKALMNSHVRTLDPSEADFFFVPVYVSCNFSTVNGFPSLGHARPLLASAVQLISTNMPFWNRTKGSDHIFVASHDYGACFHPMEDVAIADGVPEFLKNSIILQTFGVGFRHPCQDVENILIPPYVSPAKVRSTLQKSPGNGKRDIWVFFRGKMEIHPKNIRGQFYSKGVRTMIWQKFNRHRKFYLKRHRFDGYQSEIQRSVFCLCPLGWAPWSPRLVESVALGCVPVIIADGIRLPFSNTIQWSKISLTIEEKDVDKMANILEHVAATNLSVIQRNLWDPVNRRALMYNSNIEEGDATSQVLFALGTQKLHLSNKRQLSRPLRS